MNSRKRYGPPYSDRHNRRLIVSKTASAFQRINDEFLQYLDLACDDFKKGTGEKEYIETSKLSKSENNLNCVINAKNKLESGDSNRCEIVQEHLNNFHLREESSNSKYIFETQEEQEEQDDDYSLLMRLKDVNDFKIDSDSKNEVSDFEESENISKEEKDLKFIDDIRDWSIKFVHTVPHAAINLLLYVLRENTDTPFPKDAQTLLKTERDTKVYAMDTGQYCHFGVNNAILSFIRTLLQQKIDIECIELPVNIDGAPLAKSSEKGLWIISCSETILRDVEVIGIYYGEDKPSNCNELLKAFVEEITYLIKNGIEYNGKLYQIKFHALVCDAPAKAYLLHVKYHTGYSSCTKCRIEGKWLGKVCFPGESKTLRTDLEFNQYVYIDDDNYQHGETVICNVPNFGLVTNVVLDYMHLVCLGVMLKLIELWLNGPVSVKLSEKQRKEISGKILKFKNFTPADFSRKPRKFQNFRRLWKAHKLKQFLLYTGPLLLYDVLNANLYQNFLHLHVAICILVNPLLCKNDMYLNFAEHALKKFVQNYEILYGQKNVSYNVHNLLHITQDVRNFGSLDCFSAFRYENHIRKIKQLVRKGDKPLPQIARRISEISMSNNNANIKNNEYFVLEKSHSKGPILSVDSLKHQFQILRMNTWYVNSHDPRNNLVLLKQGLFVECLNFIETEDNILYVVGRPFLILSNLYSSPLESDIFNIRVVKSCTERLKLYPCQSILAKVCKLPIGENFIAIPLIHAYCTKK